MGMKQEGATSKRDSLPLRLVTAAAGIPILALAIWLGGIPLLLVTGAATLVAIWELRALLRRFGLMPWLLASLAVAGFLAAGLALREGDDGLAWLSYAILLTFASDTAAYAVGRLAGRHRLAPTISPGKTWEGAVGGIIGAAAVSAVFAWFVELDALPLVAAIPLGAGLSVLGQLGDLTESWLKRKADVKDSGNLLPGHGGILDRLDSLLPILPAVLVYVTIVTTME
ncbi:MAG: phosphatidate cytidylyltransferase [Chloroflexi bacterium]|nr:phosphatidate cytidylyltransferase [Chloroflexota bacterium]